MTREALLIFFLFAGLVCAVGIVAMTVEGMLLDRLFRRIERNIEKHQSSNADPER